MSVAATQPEAALPKPRRKPVTNSTFVRVVRYSAVTAGDAVRDGRDRGVPDDHDRQHGRLCGPDHAQRYPRPHHSRCLRQPRHPEHGLRKRARSSSRQSIALEENRLGLNTPVAVRNARYLANALTLNLGRAINMTSDSGSKEVRLILLERLPATLLLMGISELSLFFFSVFLALSLSRRYGSWWDKLVITLSPTSAAPPWFYGIFFILIFAALLKSAAIRRHGGLAAARRTRWTSA